MSISPIDRAILDLAVEDSYDLLEVQSRVQGLLSVPEEDAMRITQEHVRQLFTDGLLSVWKAQELGGDEEILPQDEAVQALADDSIWVRPEVGFPRVRILATEAGERAYYADPA